MALGKKLKATRFLKIPSKVADTIAVSQVDTDTGIFYHGDGIYTQQYYFDDVNFETLSEDDKYLVFEKYSALINSFANGGEFKITLNNRKIDANLFGQNCFLAMQDDGFDNLRNEMNSNIHNKLAKSDGLDTQLILTLRVYADSWADAEEQLHRMAIVAEMRLKEIGSSLTELKCNERLRLLYSFYHRGEEWFFDSGILINDKTGKPVIDKKTGSPKRVGGFDLTREKILGNDVTTVLAPTNIKVEASQIIMQNGKEDNVKYARVLYVKDYGTFISDNALYVTLGVPTASCMSIDVGIVNPAEAVKVVEGKLDIIENKITKWQFSQNKSMNFSATIPYRFDNQRQEVRQFLADLNERDQMMCETCITIFIMEDTLEDLDRDTKLIIDNASRAGIELAVPKNQQLEGFNTAIPLGVYQIAHKRTLTTECLAMQMPFRTQNIMHENGVYYGVNPLSKKIITVNRAKLVSGNAFILGTTGSGKSVTAKLEILSTALRGEMDIIIVDPEREYGALVKQLGGEIIQMSSTGDVHINAMECQAGYGDSDSGLNPIAAKSEFITHLITKINGVPLRADEKSLIDRAVRRVLGPYVRSKGNGKVKVPTLVDLKAELESYKEEAAHDVAIALERFTTGSLDIFAQESNVDIHSRIVCYDFYELGTELKPLAMLVTLDNIQSRIAKNRAEGRHTAVYIDEIYLMFQDQGSEEYLMNLWKRVRKYGAYMVGITQNIGDLLVSNGARDMLSNSNFLILLTQAPGDRVALAKLLNISDKQMPYIISGNHGEGLIKVGGAMIPFENKLDTDGEIYKMVTTNLDDLNRIKAEREAQMEAAANEESSIDPYVDETFNYVSNVDAVDPADDEVSAESGNEDVDIEVPEETVEETSVSNDIKEDTSDTNVVDVDAIEAECAKADEDAGLVPAQESSAVAVKAEADTEDKAKDSAEIKETGNTINDEAPFKSEASEDAEEPDEWDEYYKYYND